MVVVIALVASVFLLVIVVAAAVEVSVAYVVCHGRCSSFEVFLIVIIMVPITHTHTLDDHGAICILIP